MLPDFRGIGKYDFGVRSDSFSTLATPDDVRVCVPIDHNTVSVCDTEGVVRRRFVATFREVQAAVWAQMGPTFKGR